MIESGGQARAFARLVRPAQWVKNAFVAAPLFFTPSAVTLEACLLTLAAIACFCAVSSSIYVLNDYLDRDGDRAHPTKCHRPLAAGTVSVKVALTGGAVLAIGGLSGGLLLSSSFALIIVLYLLLNVAYSLGLKTLSLVDLFIITLGFILRVEGGAAVIGVSASAWITIMTGLLALFLALAKRRDDLVQNLDRDHRRSLDGYTVPFLDTAMAIVTAALLVAYLIYTTDVTVMTRLGTDKLFATAPFVVYGILRYLQVTMVEQRSGSPTRIALTDPPMMLAIAGWAATFMILLYI